MHVPDSMLHGAICPVTAVLGAVGLGVAAYAAFRTKDKPTAAVFGAVTSFVFAGQLLNFPISAGTSGHLMGGVLASSLLGTPFGVLAVALVVTLQALVFADGGLGVLGANVLSMALIGAGAGGIMRNVLVSRGQHALLSTAFAAWVSVVLASVGVSVMLAVDGVVSLSSVLPAMVGTHAMIGVGEALITLGALWALSHALRGEATQTKRLSALFPLVAASLMALVLSPLASSLPDGLEWVAARYQFLHDKAPTFLAPLPAYTFPALSNGWASVASAGLVGVALCFAVAWTLGKVVLRLPAQTRALPSCAA